MHRPIALVLVLALTSATGTTLLAQDRMPPIPPEKRSAEQKKAVEAVAPNGELPVYLVPFLRSPEVMTRVNGLGDYVVRGKTALSRRQSEFVILLVVRHWTQQYMWSNHFQAAVRAGVDAEIATAIGEGRRPNLTDTDDQILYDFCSELQANQSVSDATYGRTVQRFGESGVIDVIGLVGYYTTLSMAYNTSRMPMTPGGARLAPFPLGATTK